MKGLFDEIYKENYKYINALDALYFLVSEEKYPISKIAKFFLIQGYHQSVKTYKKNYLDQMELVDFYEEDLSIDNYWRITKDILDKALDDFNYVGDVHTQPYQESDYEDYFWLKDDLFNFEGFKKLGIKISDNDYEKYLTFKNIHELEKPASTLKILEDYEENLISYWNLRVLPKIFEKCGEQITLFDILNIAVRDYTVSYQFLNTFFHKFIYCPNDNLLDETQNDILIRLIEGDLQPSSDKLYKPINFNAFLKNGFPYNLVHWNVDELSIFFIKQDKEIYEYENTAPRFYRVNNNKKLEEENENLKVKLLEKEQRIKELESLHQKGEINLISLIFDESAKERYAPDLALSIKLWESIYILNPKDDSHSNKANTWITSNTGYDQSKPSATKLREITTPLINWSTHRDKNYKK
ncbi:hypothetical protein [Acinetobacter gerneri]|uniref:hypothetical protein n=1 Tax=Acinetobacter gerneri TaxID=202952 RepID=UPI003A88791B